MKPVESGFDMSNVSQSEKDAVTPHEDSRETQGRVDTAILSPEVVWKQSSFFWASQSFLLRPLTG